MKHTETTIYSIFGQIEAVVAEQMVNEGKFRKIPPRDIPMSARFASDKRALFAVIVPRKYLGEFEHRIDALRA